MYWLLKHCLVYSLWGILFTPYLVLYLFVTHAVIDGITSRITSYLWKNEKVHWFFVCIGLDQFLHYLTIFWFFVQYC